MGQLSAADDAACLKPWAAAGNRDRGGLHHGWVASPDRGALAVAHRWPAGELLGFEQPLDEGLVSLVLASEQAVCESLDQSAPLIAAVSQP